MMHTIAQLWEKQCSRTIVNYAKNIVIYIADDSKVICSILDANLRENGFTTIVFNTLEELEIKIKVTFLFSTYYKS